MRSRHVSIVIRRGPEVVYAFASDPGNLPRWAAGLASSTVTWDGDTLYADSPMGRVAFTFAADNMLGVLDHDVTLPDGTVVHNPMRVIRHPDGAEVVFTLRQLGLTDDEFDRDAAMVAADLARLTGLLEST
ncbi:SRPBCC family protein [Tsukamurella soli]|uniref:SRPBCC family protein n=1 Tax=Tsukamurella soli TaxID=644556 RepID=A0ABP8JXV6_9ACTN